MNCLNCEKYLREAIDSVYSQIYYNWEIIFWDNASTDNSAEIAKSYDKRLKYFRGEKTVPLYAGRNFALQCSKGKYIALLDCDDIWLPGKLEKQIPLFENDDEIGLVFSDSILFNERGKKKKFFKIVKPAKGDVFSELLKCNFVHLPTVVIRTEAMNSLDYWFDSRLNMIGDYDAWLRISRKWKFEYVHKPLAKYRVHKNNITNKYGRMLLSNEYSSLIENLKKTVNDSGVIYDKEIRLLERTMDIQSALLEWENNNKQKARNLIRTYIYDDIVRFVLFFLMYFPYKYVFNPLYRLYTKNIMLD